MTKRSIVTDKAPAAIGPYSQGLRTCEYIFTSGQLPFDPETGEISGSDIKEQTARVLENIKAVLEAADTTMADVVKVNVYLSDLSDFKEFNEVYAQYFPEPYPVRTTIGCQLLKALIEVDAIAYLGD